MSAALAACWCDTKARAVPVVGDPRKKSRREQRGPEEAWAVDRLRLPPPVRPPGRRGKRDAATSGARNNCRISRGAIDARTSTMCSIAAAGLCEGVFRGDMFDEAVTG